jgi:type IV pilus assembly protein PilN
MYSLDINFLKYHPDYQKKSPVKTTGKKASSVNLADLVPVYIGLGVGLVLPGIVFAALSFMQMQTEQLTQEITKYEDEGKTLDVKITNLNKIKSDTKALQSQTTALIKVFDQIRPWSAMLKDLRDRIPPRVQIETIKQTPPLLATAATPTTANNPNIPTAPTAGTLEISGYARGYADVNDFMLSLSQSKFIDGEQTKIKTAELLDAPPITGFVIVKDDKATAKPGGAEVKIKPPQVVKYTIKASLSTTPATELIDELKKKGTSGLVTRLRNIKSAEEVKK